MKATTEAIYNYIMARTSDQFYTGIGGRIYYQRAPQNPTFPYCVFYVVANGLDEYFSHGPDVERVIYQFSIFSSKASAAEAEDLLEKLKTMLTYPILTISGWNQVAWTRQPLPPIYDEDEGGVTQQAMVQFELIVSKYT